MKLTITPGQMARHAEFYQQLGQLTGAGIGVISALQHLEQHPPARSYRPPLQHTLADLAAGCTLAESLENVEEQWLPQFDIALLRAAEQSGRLDACFRLLAEYYRDRARITRQLLGELAYPVFLFHFAIFILPFPQFFTSGNWLRYLGQTLGVLVPIYVAVGLLVYAAQGRHGERWRAWFERLLRAVPILGVARRDLALGRLAAALEALLNAGVTIIPAWELAAAASGSPALRQTVQAWRPDVEAGRPPSEALAVSGQFPDLFTNQYASGEVSGRLDETLISLHRYYLEEGSRKLHHLSRWAPRLVYFGILGYIAFRVVSFYSSYFKQAESLWNF